VKERNDSFGIALQRGENRAQSFFQIEFVFDRLFADLIVLNLVPGLLIGIEFRWGAFPKSGT
jgi:hypothetical protein